MSRRMPLRHMLSVSAMVALLSGCLGAPDPADRAANGGYPELLPLEEIFAAAYGPERAEDGIEILRQRALGLRGRAAALSGPVIDASTRQRMLAMIARDRN